jgi:hypothetical protein
MLKWFWIRWVQIYGQLCSKNVTENNLCYASIITQSDRKYTPTNQQSLLFSSLQYIRSHPSHATPNT